MNPNKNDTTEDIEDTNIKNKNGNTSSNEIKSKEKWKSKTNDFEIKDAVTENNTKKKENKNNNEIIFLDDELDEELKAQIIAIIQEKEKNKEYYAKWTEWIIFKIPITNKEWKTKEILVAKKRFDKKIENEYYIQDKVQKLLPIWKDIVRVPELKWRIDTIDWDSYIIMDFIKGKTLYTSIIEKILSKKTWSTIVLENDAQADQFFLKFCPKWLDPNNAEDQKTIDNIYKREATWIKIFDNWTGTLYEEAIKDFINIIHKNWIYHRDLHEKNIILWEDGNIYIIDFGKSKETQTIEDCKDIYYEYYWENDYGIYQDDKIICEKIKELTKTSEDEEIEIWQKKAIEKQKNIAKWDSIIKYFTEIPKWFNIKDNRTTFENQVIIEANNSKYIKLDDMINANSKELNIYLFAQSKENLENLLEKIPKEIKLAKDKIKENERNYPDCYNRPLDKKKLITPHEKKIKALTTIKKKLIKIKNQI